VVAGARGQLDHYERLVTHINSDHPVYGLRPSVSPDRRVARARIETLAEEYAQSLVDVVDPSRCILLGYCFSGLVAYETARQLATNHGCAPRLLVLDAYYMRRTGRLQLEREKLRDLQSRNLRGKVSWVATRASGLAVKARARAAWVGYDVLTELHAPVPHALATTKPGVSRAESRGGLQPSEIELTLIHMDEQGRDWSASIAFWRYLARGGFQLETVEREGIRHDNLLEEPWVSTVGERISALAAGAMP
jgi:thioesterase domain-containing protein